jgi:hypothetical protein
MQTPKTDRQKYLDQRHRADQLRRDLRIAEIKLNTARKVVTDLSTPLL